MEKWKLIIFTLILTFICIFVVVLFLPINNIEFTVSLESPASSYPVYVGNSTPLIELEFTYLDNDYQNCKDKLCFLIEDGKIIDFQESYNGLSYNNRFVNITNDESIIIDRIKNGEFTCIGQNKDPQYPMSGLGNIKIYNYNLAYYNQTLYNNVAGKGIYIPVWLLYADTSGYGQVTILVWASK
jgi:hypothetical protein